MGVKVKVDRFKGIIYRFVNGKETWSLGGGKKKKQRRIRGYLGRGGIKIFLFAKVISIPNICFWLLSIEVFTYIIWT